MILAVSTNHQMCCLYMQYKHTAMYLAKDGGYGEVVKCLQNVQVCMCLDPVLNTVYRYSYLCINLQFVN